MVPMRGFSVRTALFNISVTFLTPVVSIQQEMTVYTIRIIIVIRKYCDF
jgi:hypothetical protein